MLYEDEAQDEAPFPPGQQDDLLEVVSADKEVVGQSDVETIREKTPAMLRLLFGLQDVVVKHVCGFGPWSGL